MSPLRWAGSPSISTVEEPIFASHVFGPQQAVWMPRSLTRSAGWPSTTTVGEPVMAGPTAGWGQAGQPCASAGGFARSPRRPCAGAIQFLAGTDRTLTFLVSTSGQDVTCPRATRAKVARPVLRHTPSVSTRRVFGNPDPGNVVDVS